jgi:hypothetical protein
MERLQVRGPGCAQGRLRQRALRQEGEDREAHRARTGSRRYRRNVCQGMSNLLYTLRVIHDTNQAIQAARDPEEEGDFMAFEQLMAEATAKKEKETKHKHKHDDKKHGKEKEAADAAKPTAA